MNGGKTPHAVPPPSFHHWLNRRAVGRVFDAVKSLFLMSPQDAPKRAPRLTRTARITLIFCGEWCIRPHLRTRTGSRFIRL